MIELQDVRVVFNKGTKLENRVLKGIDLKVMDGQVVTIIGGNRACKLMLMNVLSENIKPHKGKVIIDSSDVITVSLENRSSLVSRVFQDPMIGTLAGFTIEEKYESSYKTLRVPGISDEFECILQR